MGTVGGRGEMVGDWRVEGLGGGGLAICWREIDVRTPAIRTKVKHD